MLRYVELKTGYDDNGPAWMGYVKLSRSGRTAHPEKFHEIEND